MGVNYSEGYKTGETVTDYRCVERSSSFENYKTKVADTLHKVAEALSEKTEGPEVESGMAHYKKQASDLVYQSEEYVRGFDYTQVDAKVREYVKQSPGQSLLIAGGIGLIIGAILRRR
jgi:ElaB/YqjD/DUF883 family membrane-anchored ribosome-binding protein